VEFVASNPGDWMLHCHLPHHMMNQMSSMVGPMSRRNGMPAGLDMERGMVAIPAMLWERSSCLGLPIER
jgi:hypothetical protein